MTIIHRFLIVLTMALCCFNVWNWMSNDILPPGNITAYTMTVLFFLLLERLSLSVFIEGVLKNQKGI